MDKEKVINALEDALENKKNLRFASANVSFEFIEELLALLKEQEAEIRQLRLALDIAKGTCKGIKSGGGQFADMPTMQSAT